MSPDQNKANAGQPVENKALSQPPDLSPKQTKDMEVHQHGHVHEQKKWKEYVFQFLMLFLAVFLGFLAENLREKEVEKNVEHEYIESLSVDLAGDFGIAARNEASIFYQAKRVDTLQDLFFSDLKSHPKKDSLVRVCYKMSADINTFYSEFFNERTISQLLSSGTMRLIKKQGVADSIMDYHSHIKFVEVQKQLYVNSINAAREAMYDVYDISFLKTVLYEDNFFYLNPDSMNCQLKTTNPDALKKFVAVLENAKIIAFTYKKYLADMKDRSTRLHEFLVKSYGLKD